MRSWAYCGLVVIAALVSATAFGQSLADPFDGNALKNPDWVWKNEPKSWDVGKTRAGWLHIDADTGRNLWAADDASSLTQVMTGDFDVETHLTMNYQPASVVAGLVAYSRTTNDHNGRTGDWVTIKLWGRGAADGNNAVIQYQNREFDSAEGLIGIAPGFADPVGEMSLYMRLQRKNNTFTAWWKRDAGDNWTQIGIHDRAYKDPMEVGVYAGIADAAGVMTAQFEYFDDLVTPFAVSPKSKLPVAWGDLKRRSE